MEAISVHLKDEQGRQRKGEIFQLGIPLAKGCLAPDTPVALIDPESSDELPCQTSPMAYWPDGSVRWLKLQFLGDLAPEQQRTLQLHTREASSTPLSRVSCEKDRDGIAIDTGAGKFHVPASSPSWAYTGDGEPLYHQLSLNSVKGAFCQVMADGDWTIIDHGAVSLSCELQGWFLEDDARLARFRFQLTFYRHSKTVEVQTCIHNPKRARHAGGLWDLGDPGSIHFNALTIRTSVPDIQHVRLAPDPQTKAAELENNNCLLYQDSSGGENWDSLNHVNANGEVTTRFRGYRLYADNDIHSAGNRSTPLITVASPKLSIQATLPRFWQNFPSSIGLQDNELVVGLFPNEAAEAYELQGGERKTQTAYFHYGEDPEALTWTLRPVVPVLDARQYEVSQAFPWFKANAPSGPLDELIQLGLDGPSNFFAKREIIDEYGWRNFGDIFADHETLFQDAGELPLISHYNNQYDAIYGFARQFALSGDPRWYELMDDLAAHVGDIDIYHTNEDRSEYNNGLFWHTDHYLPAHTATHRTFTKYNNSSSTPGQTGGGPAEEHCYTTGLLYHYFLTGNNSSKEAVLDLAGWITALHEGNDTLIEALLKIKRYDLPRLKSILKGHPVNTHRYNFNRGTGNYLNSLIDAYLVDPRGPWLEQTESIVYETIHPKDDIHNRNLFLVEEHWSYLVFLSSLSRFLLTKSVDTPFDHCHMYALPAFCHYTRWMARYEQPFLTKTDQLEFPNHTWVAQDIRKSMLLFQASFFDPTFKDLYLNKAHYFLNYVNKNLHDSIEVNYSRLQVILLQNYGPQAIDLFNSIMVNNSEYTYGDPSNEPPVLSIPVLAARAGKRLLRAILKFKLKRENEWLKTRLDNR